MNLFRKSNPNLLRLPELSIVVARLNGDGDGSATKLLCKSLEKIPDLKIHSTGNCLFYYGQNESELYTQVHSVLHGSKAEAVLWGSIVQHEDRALFHLSWTAQEILFTNHPSGRYQPGAEIPLPALKQDDLFTIVRLLVETRRVESLAAKTTTRLKQAIADLRALTSRHDREWNQESLARLGSLLGYALAVAGWKGEEPDLLNEAVLIFQELSQSYTRENSRDAWTSVQNNLGYALLALGKLTSSTEHLETALEAFQNVLWEHDREKKPLLWAAALNNYGYALTVLANKEDHSRSVSSLEEAIDALEESLQVYTHVRWPREWAMIQTNLGNAQLKLGEKKPTNEPLHASVRSLRNALLELNPKRVPIESAMVQISVGIALMQLGEREQRDEYFHEAQEAFHEASLIFAREKEPIPWSRVPDSLRSLYGITEDCSACRMEDYLHRLRKKLRSYVQQGSISLREEVLPEKLENPLS